MIAPFRQIRSLWRNHKYKRMRARKKLPPCDWWDYKYELADFIRQGLTGLLYEGITDWDSPTHRKEKEDLEFVLRWATEFPWYESAVIAMNDEDLEDLKKKFPPDSYMVITREELADFEKKTEKAFKLLARNLHTLWD